MLQKRPGLSLTGPTYRDPAQEVTTANNMMESAKATYYNDLIADCGSDQKALSRVVKELLGIKRSPVYPTRKSDPELCTLFHDYFIDKISALQAQLEALPLDGGCCTGL